MQSQISMVKFFVLCFKKLRYIQGEMEPGAKKRIIIVHWNNTKDELYCFYIFWKMRNKKLYNTLGILYENQVVT